MKLDDLEITQISQLNPNEDNSNLEYRAVFSRSIGLKGFEFNTLYVELVQQTKVSVSNMKKLIYKTSDKTSIPFREKSELMVCYDFTNWKPSTEVFYDSTILSHQNAEISIIIKIAELLFGSPSSLSEFWFSGIRQVVKLTFTYED